MLARLRKCEKARASGSASAIGVSARSRASASSCRLSPERASLRSATNGLHRFEQLDARLFSQGVPEEGAQQANVVA